MALRKRRGGEMCSAVVCSNARYRYDCAGISFFRFPTDEERSRKWVENSGRKDLLWKTAQELRTGGYTLCSKHFEPKQFLNQDNRNRLVWNAVPTLFDNPRARKRKSSTSSSREKGSDGPPSTQETARGVTKACAVFGCPNSSEQLGRWSEELCPVHKVKIGQDDCQCEPPFTLRPFPTDHQNLRNLWIEQVRKTLPEKDKMWEPDEQSRVCSVHFARGTTFPTLRLHPKTGPSPVTCRRQQSASGGRVPKEKRRRVEGDPRAPPPSGDEGRVASSPGNPAVALAGCGTSASPSCGPAARGDLCPPTWDVADLSSPRTCSSSSSSALTVDHAYPSRSACRDCLAKDKVIQHMQSEIWALQEEVEAIKEKLRKSSCESVVGYKVV